MIPTYLMPLANHLWQSTAFLSLMALLCFVLRKHPASIRFWLWWASSLKFLIPFGWLIELGSRLTPSLGPATVQTPVLTPVSSVLSQIGQPFALAVPAPLLANVPNASTMIPAVLLTAWLCGFAISASCWLRTWLRMGSAVRGAPRLETDSGLDFGRFKIVASPWPVEPCVCGIFHPVLLMPDGIREHFTAGQLAAICLHELCHVRRRDNLTAAVHMVVEAVFWFYPPVYWIGRRLMNERETACDEEVLRILPEPETYAQAILAVCRFAIHPAPVSAAGVAGPDLKRRIEAIMAHRAVHELDRRLKLLLITALCSSIAGPLCTGALLVHPVRAQTVPAAVPPFGVASIKPNRSGERNSGFRRFTGGELNARNITLKMLISWAYDLPQDRILQGPGWLDSDRYDILAKPDPSPRQPIDQSMTALRLRTQALLADLFQLSLHKETRQLPVFRLVVDKSGPKNLHPPKSNSPDLFTNGRQVTCQAASMEFFAKNFLTGELGGPVLDETGIKGNFDFSMDWTSNSNSPPGPANAGEPPAALDPGPSLLTALRAQLGLKLEAGKGPVEVLIIDRAVKASEN